jgi:ligand-binding sensor domain-containing protein/signal transduction histidine kinase
MKYSLPFFLFVLLLLAVKTNTVFCQQIIFNKVPYPDGKTFDFVTGIAQDPNGFMWFSTKKGLYSYDGNRMTSYKNNPRNTNSLISDFCESVYADNDGIIWIGTLGKGLDRLDPETGIFTHFHHDPKNSASLSNDTVTAILRDKQGTLWIGTHGGLTYLDQKTNKFFHYHYKANDLASISNNQVRVIYEDRQGTLWIGTGSPYADDGGRPENGGLNRLNKKTGKFTRYLHDPKNIHSLLTNNVSAIFEDSKGVFWIGTSLNGLHKMNIQQGTFQRIVYDHSHPENLSVPPSKKESPIYEHITFITQDAAGSYWLGTSDEGLFYLNPSIGKLIHYQGAKNSLTGFTDNGAWKAFTSSDGILWIGCTQGNIYHVNPIQKKLPHTDISSSPVHYFYEEPDGVFWIGTEHELLRTDKKNGNAKRYVNEAKPSKVNENLFWIIKSDRQGNIWAGTSGGLNLWDKQNEKFIRYKHDPKNSNSLSNNNVLAIFEDRAANFWIGTAKGLNQMDRKTGLITPYFLNPADTSSWGQNIATSVLEDKTGKLWVSFWNGGGVNLFDRENKKFKNYLKGTNIMIMYEDSDHVLWAGGAGADGLFKYNREIDNFTRYSDSGLMSGISEVYGIIEDNQKNLWLNTTDGIVRINPQRNETNRFGLNYGVAKSELTWGSIFKGLNGDLYFGTKTGYYSFSPVELIKNLKQPKIIFNGFRLAEHIVKPGDGGPVKESLSKLKNIRLKYSENIFSFDFTAIDYANPEENRMIYMLQNYDNGWIQASSERRAYYFNIPPGKYLFRVKAVNSYGVWAEKTIEVSIMPPWWRSWWAYCFYGLFFVAGVFGVDRFQRHRLLKSEREKNQQREIDHAKEIEKAYTELKETQTQLIQSEKMASLGELTAGIAHEIQNPLNFVNNFSEVNSELIEELQEERKKEVRDFDNEDAILNDIKENEQKINHHGKRADAIVKGMLQHSRSSNGVKEPTDINALTDEYLRLAYHGLRAKDKSFNATMKTDFNESIGNINIIPQDIGRVILNLITNAFYSVTEKKQQQPVGYEPTVTVSTGFVIPPSGGPRGVKISVKDNGNGIPQKALDKIFQPFFTTKPSGQGTGLGLSMSYEIVTKGHGGELKVDTKEGEGAEFTIILTV